MIEVTQTKFIPKGDCYAACIASIFELDINKLPHLPEDDEIILQKYPIKNPEYYGVAESRTQWWYWMWGEWFAANNLMGLKLPSKVLPDQYDRNRLTTYHIITGISPRDKEPTPGKTHERHSVVGKHGLIWFDPHPDRTGLLSVDEFEIIIPTDPTKPILQGYKDAIQ